MSKSHIRIATTIIGFVLSSAVPLMVSAQSSGTYCPRLSTNMQRGAHDSSTGGQINELQHFLRSYFSINSSVILTGYFGSITQANVIKFQQEQNLPALGFVGPLTRAAIAQVCGGNMNTTQSGSGYLSANVVTGPAPLSVTFTTTNIQSIGVGTIDFGDGMAEDDPACPPTSGKACTSTTNTHIYTKPGVYTVKLLKYDQGSSLAQTLIASLTITVNNQIVNQTGGSTNTINGAGSCVTPWGSVTIQNGGTIANVPYFTNGQLIPGSAEAEGSEKCQNGAWIPVARDFSHVSCSTPWQNIIVQDGQVTAAVPYFTNGNTSTSQEAYGTSYKCSNGSWVFIPKVTSQI